VAGRDRRGISGFSSLRILFDWSADEENEDEWERQLESQEVACVDCASAGGGS
jgi:hypothetical protein